VLFCLQEGAQEGEWDAARTTDPALVMLYSAMNLGEEEDEEGTFWSSDIFLSKVTITRIEPHITGRG